MPARRRSRGRRWSRRTDAGEGNAIPRAVFDRLVREIAWYMITDLNGRSNTPMRWGPAAVEAIQVVAESFAIELFEDALLCARHAGRQCTVNVEDIQLARRLRGYQRAS